MKQLLIILLAFFTVISFNVNAQIDCGKCNGTGKIENECNSCHGTGNRECSLCYGKKQIRCTVCGGAGFFRCTHCYGVNSENCSYCNDEGNVNCERCNSEGFINCTSCDATGLNRCMTCNGNGKHVWNCTECNGTGKVASSQSDSDLPEKYKQGYSGTYKVYIDPNWSEEEKQRAFTKARLQHRQQMMESRK